MIYNKYRILPTATFKRELKEILYYLKNKINEPLIAKEFYKDVINQINSLRFMPQRFKKIETIYNKKLILRKIPVKNYIIIYEVDNNTRTSFYFTYLS